jgi:hypothetical protein
VAGGRRAGRQCSRGERGPSNQADDDVEGQRRPRDSWGSAGRGDPDAITLTLGRPDARPPAEQRVLATSVDGQPIDDSSAWSSI